MSAKRPTRLVLLLVALVALLALPAFAAEPRSRRHLIRRRKTFDGYTGSIDGLYLRVTGVVERDSNIAGSSDGSSSNRRSQGSSSSDATEPGSGSAASALDLSPPDHPRALNFVKCDGNADASGPGAATVEGPLQAT